MTTKQKNLYHHIKSQKHGVCSSQLDQGDNACAEILAKDGFLHVFYGSWTGEKYYEVSNQELALVDSDDKDKPTE